MKRVLKWFTIVLAVLFIAAQFYRPSLSSPPADESKSMRTNTRMTPEVAGILDRSCKDCHSSKTEWPWYSHVSPVSWYLKNHIDEGRQALSFSEWGTYAQRKREVKLHEICEQVETGQMPLSSYLLLHPAAKLSDDDRRVLCEWTKQEEEHQQDTGQAAGQP
jgi:hypothetical protein